jgi:hypothetical protein
MARISVGVPSAVAISLRPDDLAAETLQLNWEILPQKAMRNLSAIREDGSCCCTVLAITSMLGWSRRKSRKGSNWV